MRPDLGGEISDRDRLEDPSVRHHGLLLELVRPSRDASMSVGLLPVARKDLDDVIRGRGPGGGRHAVTAEASASSRHPSLSDERKKQLVDRVARKRQGSRQITRFHVARAPVLQFDQSFEGFSLASVKNC